jgi:hypothetical protein
LRIPSKAVTLTTTEKLLRATTLAQYVNKLIDEDFILVLIKYFNCNQASTVTGNSNMNDPKKIETPSG